MSFSLYAATVPSFLQILDSVGALLNKAESFCDDKGLSHENIIQARLAPDMLPFTYQVKSTAEHSIGAIEAVRTGLATPSLTTPPDSFAGLRDKLANAQEALRAIDPSEIEGFLDRDVRFEFKASRRDFTAQGFLMSYAQPNFYFHATTAYDILRHNGVTIGKMDFIGSPLEKT